MDITSTLSASNIVRRMMIAWCLPFQNFCMPQGQKSQNCYLRRKPPRMAPSRLRRLKLSHDLSSANFNFNSVHPLQPHFYNFVVSLSIKKAINSIFFLFLNHWSGKGVKGVLSHMKVFVFQNMGRKWAWQKQLRKFSTSSNTRSINQSSLVAGYKKSLILS